MQLKFDTGVPRFSLECFCMAQCSLYCADVPLRTIHSLTHATYPIIASVWFYQVVVLNSPNGADVPLRTCSTNHSRYHCRAPLQYNGQGCMTPEIFGC